MQNKKRLAEKALEQGGGILRLAPTWIADRFADQKESNFIRMIILFWVREVE